MAGLENTLSGQNVNGSLFSDLPPEAQQAAAALLSLNGMPSPQDLASAQTLATQAYAPLMQQIQGATPPTPTPVPQGPGDMNTFLGLLAGNLAGTVNPQLAEPTQQEFAAQQTEKRNVKEMNARELTAFRKSQTEAGLHAAADAASTALKMALDSGDDKLATSKALDLARLNDALDRRKAKEEHGYRLKEARAKATATASPEIDPQELDAAVESVANGETDLTNYPIKLRAKITSEVRDRGLRIVPTKVRTAIDALAAAKNVVTELRQLSTSVNTAKADFLSRGIQGSRNVWNALNQSTLAADLQAARKGLAGNLSRAVSSERGVLTDQDLNRALGMLPGLFDSGPYAERQIDRLEKFITSKEEAAKKNYMSPMQRKIEAAATAGAAPPTNEPSGDRTLVQKADGSKVWVRGDVKAWLQANKGGKVIQ